jgi:hypothetical protein
VRFVDAVQAFYVVRYGGVRLYRDEPNSLCFARVLARP